MGQQKKNNRIAVAFMLFFFWSIVVVFSIQVPNSLGTLFLLPLYPISLLASANAMIGTAVIVSFFGLMAPLFAYLVYGSETTRNMNREEILREEKKKLIFFQYAGFAAGVWMFTVQIQSYTETQSIFNVETTTGLMLATLLFIAMTLARINISRILKNV
jgi:hypothetical protein